MAVNIIGWPDRPLYLGIAAISHLASKSVLHVFSLTSGVSAGRTSSLSGNAELFNAEQDGVKHLGLAEMPVCRNCDPIVLKVLLDNTVLITDYNCDLVYWYGFEHLNLIGQHTFSADVDKRLPEFLYPRASLLPVLLLRFFILPLLIFG